MRRNSPSNFRCLPGRANDLGGVPTVSDAKLREQNSMLFWYATQKAPISVEFAGACLQTNLNIRELNTSLREYCSSPTQRPGGDGSFAFGPPRMDSPATPSPPVFTGSPSERKFDFPYMQYVADEGMLPESMVDIAAWDGDSGSDEMEGSNWSDWS